MKRFIIVVLGLLCAPLVAYAAWRLVGLCLQYHIPLVLLSGVILTLIGLFIITDSIELGKWKKLLLLWLDGKPYRLKHLKRIKNISEEERNSLIEKLNRFTEEEEAAIINSLRFSEKKPDVTTRTIGGIMASFLVAIFTATVLFGTDKFRDGCSIGNVILTSDAIYSKDLIPIAYPSDYGWSMIHTNGQKYIRYGDYKNNTVYDLNGNLVEVEQQ